MSTLAATNLKNASSGSNNIVLAADGTTTIAAPSNIIKSGTAVASTSGTAIDFTSIPSWVKRITVMLNKVSTTGTSGITLQLGTSAGIDSTANYTTSTLSTFAGTSFGNANSTTSDSLLLTGAFGSSSASACGVGVLTSFGGNSWNWQFQSGDGNSARHWNGQGQKNLSGTLDRIRVLAANGTDAFDAGSINILYEG